MLSEEKKEMLVRKIGKQICDMFEENYEVQEGNTCPDMFYCQKAARQCIENKAKLIDMLSRHPQWDEDNLRVHFESDFTRPADAESARKNVKRIGSVIKEALLGNAYLIDDEYVEYEDGDGNKHGEFMYRMKNERDPLLILGLNLTVSFTLRSMFTDNNTIDKTAINFVKAVLPDAHIHEGAKSTKALFKLLRQYGYQEKLQGLDVVTNLNSVTGETKDEDALARVHKYYTDYADDMNPLTVTRHTVLSVNPMDFLRMSYGNSWTSCHIIDDDNSGQSGCYSAGCWSYAYDAETMIFFTVTADVADEDITYAGKYTRQLYFWNGHSVFGSRVYPANDNLNSPIYAENRQVVEQVIADCNDFGNMWKKLSLTSRDSNVVDARGYQYHDYYQAGYPIYAPSLLVPEEGDEQMKDFLRFHVGSNSAICVCCGDYLDEHELPICESCHGGRYVCEECGDRYRDSDDGTWVTNRYGDEVWVCNDCAERYYTWDEFNDRYIHEDCAIHVSNYGYVHEDDVNADNGFVQCESCGEWFYVGNYDSGTETSEGWFCEVCADIYFDYCSRCGEYHRKNDMAKDEDGDWVCLDCMDDDEHICYNCKTLHKEEDMTFENNLWFCNECYNERRFVCEECGEVYFLPANGRYHYNDKTGIEKRVCQNCINNYYSWYEDEHVWKRAIAHEFPEGIECFVMDSSYRIYTKRSDVLHTNFYPIVVCVPVASDDTRKLKDINWSWLNGWMFERLRLDSPDENERNKALAVYQAILDEAAAA